MKKKDLADVIADATGSTKAKGAQALERVVAAITGAIREDGYARIQGLCSFSLTHRSARVGRNPKTGEAVPIPSKTVVKIKPLTALKEAVEK